MITGSVYQIYKKGISEFKDPNTEEQGSKHRLQQIQ